MAIKKLLDFIGWPITFGVLIALLALTLLPQLRNQNMLRQNTVTAQPQPAPTSYADAVSRAAPGVVNIHTDRLARPKKLVYDKFWQRYYERQLPARRVQNSLGSGVIISQDGYLLTNNHVIENAYTIFVQLFDGRQTEAKLIGTDKESDLAVLKIDLEGLSPITLGSPEEARVGDVVLAIGNPYGVGQTVTQGIISATGRNVLNLNLFEGFIQTDAAVNPGNSGGALIDAYGNLMGINTIIFNDSGSATGIGFAIPSDYANKALQDIIEYGLVVRGWLGFDAETLTPQLAQSLGATSQTGIVINRITPDGPAQKADLKPGDIITHLDNIEVTIDSMRQVANTKPGTTLPIKLIRHSKIINSTITVGIRPSNS